MNRLSRRQLMATAPGLLGAAYFGPRAWGQQPTASAAASGMIVRMQQPQNLESPIAELGNQFITPNEKFFVRSHFAVPKIDPEAYRLEIEGLVEKPLSLSLSDLRAMEKVTSPITLECAGNGRVFLIPQVRGLQWGQGAVGTAEWSGVPLGAILDRAKVKAGATEVILVGSDRGAITADPATPGPIAFDRSLPLSKAQRPEVLLAYQMNGAELPVSHGFPVRAVVGGWYGMASVKWLRRIIVIDRPHTGYWQTFDYSYYVRNNDLPGMAPVTEMQPKSAISRPTLGEVVRAGSNYLMKGIAWAGDATIAKVEVSMDDGKSWAPTRLIGEKKPYCWRQWEYDWKVPATTGPINLLARATDVSGATQPVKRDPDRRSYMINHLVPIEVIVR